MKRVLIATSNAGKLRDFAGAAYVHGIEVASLPNFSSLPLAVEDGLTFEANARKKAEYYSRHAPGEIVIADDSGLAVDALGGAPGVHSARYAADEPHLAESNTDDDDNNARLVRELKNVPLEERSGRFVCVIAARQRAWSSTLRVVRMGSGMIPYFISPRFKRHLPSLHLRKNRLIATVARPFVSSWTGTITPVPRWPLPSTHIPSLDS